MKIGKNLKKLRKEKGATQTEVANFIGVRQNTYSQYENDSRQPDIDTLIALSRFYETSLDVVVGVDVKINKIEFEGGDLVEDFKRRLNYEGNPPDLTDEQIKDLIDLTVKELMVLDMLKDK